MAFLPGFEYDIFISYAHVDNLVATTLDRPWVESFHRDLEHAVAKRIGESLGSVKFWRDDKKLDGAHLFDETIEEAIDKSAIFITFYFDITTLY